jgi:uncharacterized HhH-GPD family protein
MERVPAGARTQTAKHELHFTGDEAADALLSRDPFALLAGMLLDQQFPMERAFSGPWRLVQRLDADARSSGGTREAAPSVGLDPQRVAALDAEEFAGLMATPPVVHRYPRSMAARLQTLARYVIDTYDGDASALWSTASSGQELLARLKALPGFGEQKARIFVAVLGKRLGVQPDGWREAAGPYGEEGSHRSVADVDDADSLARVRAFKQAEKESKKAKG